MSAQVIKIVRVMDLEVKYGPDGEKILVPRFKCEREQKPEDYDINYDSDGQRYMVARWW
jgi:hypothetical protein